VVEGKNHGRLRNFTRSERLNRVAKRCNLVVLFQVSDLPQESLGRHAQTMWAVCNQMVTQDDDGKRLVYCPPPIAKEGLRKKGESSEQLEKRSSGFRAGGWQPFPDRLLDCPDFVRLVSLVDLAHAALGSFQ